MSEPQCPKPEKEDLMDEIMSIAQPPDGFVPVPFKGGTIYVTRDYHFQHDIRWPMDAHDAEELARKKNCLLPTKEMVDAIWAAADIKLAPEPISWDEKNTTLPVFIRHNEMIEEQLDNIDPRREGKLYAGHKKDIIQGRRRGRVAIYGWHYQSGTPIQPVSNVHGAGYKDYSHGVRLVFPMMQNQAGKWVHVQS